MHPFETLPRLLVSMRAVRDVAAARSLRDAQRRNEAAAAELRSAAAKGRAESAEPAKAQLRLASG